jgi:anti-sigma regulatory factor (Ser/Thr protein kinase)
MKEISLHILDIAENSIAAGAKNIRICVVEDLVNDQLFVEVEDDGRGMDEETVKKVVDPFVTSRTTRKVGLGIPLLKEATELCNGTFHIQSTPGKGTLVQVSFQFSHIDRMPLGDLAGTYLTLLIANPEVDWDFQHQSMIGKVDQENKSFDFDSRVVKKELDGISLCEPEILGFLRDYFYQGISTIKDFLNIMTFTND